MLMTIKSPVSTVIVLDIKKAAHERAEDQICLDKLYNACSSIVKLKKRPMDIRRLRIAGLYETGYQDADAYDWSKLPLSMAFELVDGYKLRALQTGNEYFAGLAQGAEDLVMGRVIEA